MKEFEDNVHSVEKRVKNAKKMTTDKEICFKLWVAKKLVPRMFHLQ